MASLVQLVDLRNAAKDRADMQNSNFITTAEWNRYINSAAKELYDILISKGLSYTTIKSTLITDGATDTFALPVDFYKLEGIDYQVGGLWQPMMQFQFIDRNRFQNYETLVMYRLIGTDKIVFAPRPPAQTYNLWYTPALALLVADSDTLNGVNGWEEYVIVRAAIWALQKEESNTGDLKSDLAYLKSRIEEMAENRDQGLPARVSDVNRAQYLRDPGMGWDTY